MKMHTFQIRPQQSIQEILIHPRYLEDAEFHEQYDGRKSFGARALPPFRARACRMFCLLSSILMIFEFSKRNDIWRAPRVQVRARQDFFYHHIVHEILNFLDNLDVFISLKLIAVDVFEMYAFSWKKKFFSKKFGIFEF